MVTSVAMSYPKEFLSTRDPSGMKFPIYLLALLPLTLEFWAFDPTQGVTTPLNGFSLALISNGKSRDSV